MLHMKCTKGRYPGGGVPRNSMMGPVRCWRRSHFQYWNDYNGVSFSKEIIEWDRAFSMYFLVSGALKMGRFGVEKVLPFHIQLTIRATSHLKMNKLNQIAKITLLKSE